MDTAPPVAAVIVLWALAVSSPLWSVVAFGAYAIGRRQYSLAMLLALLVVEAVSTALAIALFRMAIVAKE